MTARVLFVSFFYPPFNSIGGLRVSKMTRYLHEAGWDVRVLTSAHDDVAADQPVELPEDLVIRAPYWDVNALPKMLLGRDRVRSSGFELTGATRSLAWAGHLYRDLTNIPDAQVGWYRSAVSAGKRLLGEWRPDVVVSSSSPATAHYVARALARVAGAPWIAGYRDPWIDPMSRERPWPIRRLDGALERGLIRHAAAIESVSDAWASELHARFPHIPVYVVPNGFDAGDYAAAAAPLPGPLVLSYTGRLYPRQDPGPLFAALRTAIAAGTVRREDVCVRFLGRYLAAARDGASAAGLEDIISVSPPVTHHEALASQQRAHVNLLFLSTDADVGWRPAKLYEYLGARRPILLLGGTPAHEARRITLDCNAGVAPDGVKAIASQIGAWAAELRTTGTVRHRGDEARIAQFERRVIAGRVAEILTQVTDRSRPANRRS